MIIKILDEVETGIVSAKKLYESEKSLIESANEHNNKEILRLNNELFSDINESKELEAKLSDVESEFAQCKQHRDRLLEERNSARVEVNTLRAENARIRDELQITRKRLVEYENVGILQRIRNLFRVVKQ